MAGLRLWNVFVSELKPLFGLMRCMFFQLGESRLFGSRVDARQ